MTTSTPSQVRELLRSHCFCRDLSDEHLEELVRRAELVKLPAGALVLREGEPATTLHLLIDGRVSIQLHVPGRGEHAVDAVESCETVGWSWLVPPYRWFFDARAVTDVTAVSVDATALRRLAEADPAFGYALLRQVAAVMLERMQAARVRLADLYGGPAP